MKRMNKAKWRKPMLLRALCFRFWANNNYISANTFIKRFLYSRCCVRSSAYIIAFTHHESRRKTLYRYIPHGEKNLRLKNTKIIAQVIYLLIAKDKMQIQITKTIFLLPFLFISLPFFYSRNHVFLGQLML